MTTHKREPHHVYEGLSFLPPTSRSDFLIICSDKIYAGPHVGRYWAFPLDARRLAAVSPFFDGTVGLAGHCGEQMWLNVEEGHDVVGLVLVAALGEGESRLRGARDWSKLLAVTELARKWCIDGARPPLLLAMLSLLKYGSDIPTAAQALELFCEARTHGEAELSTAATLCKIRRDAGLAAITRDDVELPPNYYHELGAEAAEEVRSAMFQFRREGAFGVGWGRS